MIFTWCLVETLSTLWHARTHKRHKTIPWKCYFPLHFFPSVVDQTNWGQEQERAGMQQQQQKLRMHFSLVLPLFVGIGNKSGCKSWAWAREKSATKKKHLHTHTLTELTLFAIGENVENMQCTYIRHQQQFDQLLSNKTMNTWHSNTQKAIIVLVFIHKLLFVYASIVMFCWAALLYKTCYCIQANILTYRLQASSFDKPERSNETVMVCRIWRYWMLPSLISIFLFLANPSLATMFANKRCLTHCIYLYSAKMKCRRIFKTIVLNNVIGNLKWKIELHEIPIVNINCLAWQYSKKK